MKAFPLRFPAFAARLLTITLISMMAVTGAFAQAQASAADLVGSVVDPDGAVVPGATIVIRNESTGVSRTTTTNESGEYQFIGLPPGTYKVTASAATFKTISIDKVALTVGQRAELKIPLEVGGTDVIVDVDVSQVELVETTSSTVANTIDEKTIENLPINERSATGFALTLSTVGRDNGRPIGPAPTSGINVGGQRGRSTLVQVDGADFTDNSVNAARTTVSQEAVQEYQVATNSYAPEFGRAIGGIVNVVTKRGGNDFNGNAFYYIRDRRIQARNPFAPVQNPDFRRTQWGGTFGGPIVKDKTHFFASYERRDRDESGFYTADPSRGLGNSITLGAPILPFTQTFDGLTADQVAFANTLIGTGNAGFINTAVQYLYLASGGTSTALTGTNPLISAGGAIPAGQVIGPRFFLTGAPVPTATQGTDGQFIAFRPLNDLQRVFPVTENTNFFSIRGDHVFNEKNTINMRFGWNTNDVTGIQVESQNQSLGQNDFSRTGVQDLTDYSFSTTWNTFINSNMTNEFKFSYGRRETSFTSQNGEAVAFNISGTAFIGRELFSPVVRTENRYQFADNFNWVVGDHIFKFGGDYSFVDIPSFIFELNFAGLFNFGPTRLTFPSGIELTSGAACIPGSSATCQGVPNFTPVQAYGIGFPSIYVQGFGDPTGNFSNKPLAFYLQDTWQVTDRVSINYGVRYDAEFTRQIDPVGVTDPLSGIALSAADILAAQDAVGVQQGIPRDLNNWAPRFGMAVDVFGNGKTVIRGALGLFYDHPLLAIATNSDVGDASQQQQSVLTAGSPASTALAQRSSGFPRHSLCSGRPANSGLCSSRTGRIHAGCCAKC